MLVDPEILKTGTLAPSLTVQPKRILDLEGVAFSQDGRFMSNKKRKLLEGSFKCSKKGCDEIRVSAPKFQPTTNSELIPIFTLPVWARELRTVPCLSRVQ